MKKILIFLLSFSLLHTNAQVEKIINVPYTPSATPTWQALINLPSDYTTATTKKYPLLVFCHGDGEAGTNISLIYNSLGSGGPAYFIEHGQWPASFTNPVTGAQEQFIVVSPQANAWGPNGDQLNNIVAYVVANYRVDANRIHLTGLSAGSAGVVEYASQLDPNETTVPTVGVDARKYPAASMVPMSQATYDPPQSWGNVAVANLTPCWGFGDTINDIHGNETQDYTIVINKAKPGFARMTKFNTGHGPWNPFYIPTYTEKFTWNGVTANYSIYTWMLANARTSGNTSTPPVVIPPVTTPPVTVPPATGPRKPQKFVIQPGVLPNIAPAGDVGIKIPQGSLIPGDTVIIPNTFAWTYGEINAYGGTAANPIVVINSGGQVVFTGGITVRARHLKWTGTGVPGIANGFKSTNPLSPFRSQSPFGFTITDSSSDVEVEHVFIYKTGEGFNVKNENDCDPGLQFPAWTISNIRLHDNTVIGCWDEAFYLGNTSPDNGATSYDPRPVICNGLTVYPRPFRIGPIYVYNNYIDSSGRGGVQLASASGGVSYITNNIILHSGMNGDDQQGTGVSTGAYTKAVIRGNTIRNTFTWNVAVLGGDSVVVDSNYLDSAGMLRHYNLASTSKENTDPSTEPVSNDSLTWVQTAFAKTVQNDGKDSTVFIFTNNSMGICRNVNNIDLLDNLGLWKKTGSFFCNNIVRATGKSATIFLETPTIAYSTCGTVTPPPPPAPVPPTVSAGFNQTVTLPVPGVNLVGSVTAGDTAKVTQTWGQVSGPNTATITNGGQTAAIASGLVAGTYVFRLTATSKNGLSASATATVVVNPAPVVTPPAKTIKSITINYIDGTSETKP